MEIGIALLIDAARTAYELKQDGFDAKAAVDTAFKMVIVPQLEGLLPGQLRLAREALERRGYRASLEAFSQLYPEASGGAVGV